MPFIVYDREQTADLPQTPADLSNEQIQALVDIYVDGGDALTMRKQLGYPRRLCKDVYSVLESVRVEMEQAVLADETLTAAKCLNAVNTLNSRPTVKQYVCTQIVNNACSEGTWEDYSTSVRSYFDIGDVEVTQAVDKKGGK